VDMLICYHFSEVKNFHLAILWSEGGLLDLTDWKQLKKSKLILSHFGRSRVAGFG